MWKVALVLLLLTTGASAADPDTNHPLGSEEAVLTTYKRMEEADRKGDGQLWFSLRDKKTLDAMDPSLKAAIQKGGHARPAVRYEAVSVRVSTPAAVLIGKVVDTGGGTTQYQTVTFVVENGDWKVAREQWSDTPFDPFVLYALLPPKDGSFASSPAVWKRVAYASPNLGVVDKKDVQWKMQAAFDESFLYVRFEALAALPAPGSRIKPELATAGKTGGPPPPPPMRVKIGEAVTAQFSVSDVVSTRAVKDAKGRPAPAQSAVSYSLFVKNAAGEDIFQHTMGDDTTGKLLAVQDKFIDIRIPLRGLGVQEGAKPKIDLEEADAIMRILPYQVATAGDH